MNELNNISQIDIEHNYTCNDRLIDRNMNVTSDVSQIDRYQTDRHIYHQRDRQTYTLIDISQIYVQYIH